MLFICRYFRCSSPKSSTVTPCCSLQKSLGLFAYRSRPREEELPSLRSKLSFCRMCVSVTLCKLPASVVYCHFFRCRSSYFVDFVRAAFLCAPCHFDRAFHCHFERPKGVEKSKTYLRYPLWTKVVRDDGCSKFCAMSLRCAPSRGNHRSARWRLMVKHVDFCKRLILSVL